MPPSASPNISARHTAIDANDLDALARELRLPLRHPDADTLRSWSALTADWAHAHLTSLPDQRIGKTASRAAMEALLRESAPEQGTDFETILAQFVERVAPHAMRTNHPRFFAFIPGAPSPVSVLGDWLCAAVNFFDGVWLEAAGPAQAELVVLDWFKEFLGYPPGASGILTGGGSEATLTALAVARERLTYEERARAVLYVTEHRHWSADRAARILGLRPDRIHPVPADDAFRLSPQALAEMAARDRASGLLPWALVANAGATNTGTVDPLRALAEVCRREGLWLHVDAAYGWSAALTEEGKEALDGIALADSLTLDPHKWFAQTFEAGCVLVREGRRLAETFALRPDYMKDVEPGEDEVNFADCGLALTRRFRALKIWLSIKVLGLGWFRELVARCCRLAEYVEALLSREGVFEILSPRQLSIVAFRYVPPGMRDEAVLDRLNMELLEKVRATGRVFLSSTRLRGRVALRFCFVNWRTTAPDVEEAVRLLVALGERLA
ncbi:MAG: aminotransferase class V-fold PLP-dependent enzyme [Gemmataceae bacterium]|nr:aminotransferase class V-fold PLP-dependent enzyme [Gemmataceae bacterium]